VDSDAPDVSEIAGSSYDQASPLIAVSGSKSSSKIGPSDSEGYVRLTIG